MEMEKTGGVEGAGSAARVCADTSLMLCRRGNPGICYVRIVIGCAGIDRSGFAEPRALAQQIAADHP
jgi:hypothetical protein